MTATIQSAFANRAESILKADENVVGLAVGGSWLSGEIDKFSDLDLIIVTGKEISYDKDQMLRYAEKLGNLLTGFTGEHVGEPRLLICLYDDPLLHVDLKFVTLEEFKKRVETPAILLDKEGLLQQALSESSASFPHPDFQWIEDRFWIWVHYALLKIGRGEYLEALDFLGYLRMTVLGPLLQIRNGKLPRGVRKVEMDLDARDLRLLIATIPHYEKKSLLASLRNALELYRVLRSEIFGNGVRKQTTTEAKVMEYFDELESVIG